MDFAFSNTLPVYLDNLSNAVDNLLLGDQVASLLDQSQQCVDVLGPLVQDLVGMLGFGKRHKTRWPVNLGIDRLGHHQLGQKLLALLVWQIQKLCQALCCDAGVVLGDHANVL